jgi:anti-sigma regulatory factor (Ser/Thr protein kinase)
MARAVELLGRPASVRAARVFTGDVLAQEGVEASAIELAVLLVSELVTNAVVHAPGRIA